MSIKRFEYQRKAVIEAIQRGGTVLNIGCNTDPAGLKNINPDKVFNADKNTYDPILKEPIKADFYFDITKQWPRTGLHELIILGDVLEHLFEDQWRNVLWHCRLISNKLCITVPQDNRLFEINENGLYHVTYVTKPFLQKKLQESRLRITDLVELDNIEDGKIMWWEKYYFLTAKRI